LVTDTLPIYKKKDFQTDQEIRWCPGCGDYAILSAVQMVFAELGVKRENFVFISGIGCSSRFPYYMNTFGFHTIHGRAPAIATGVKLVRPDLDVWVATGDGDSLSIGGNHTIHMLRRNVGLKVLMFNNKIYGLTKGQYSPTSEVGKKAKSTPFGSVDRPFHPLSVALGSEATFVARSVDVFQAHLKETLKKAAAHRGSAYVEILQNCNIFNDGAWETITEKETRHDSVIELVHGKPLIFGKNRDKGIRMNGLELEVVTLGDGITESDLLVHNDSDGGLSHSDRSPARHRRRSPLRRPDQRPNPRRASQARQGRPGQADESRRHLGSPRVIRPRIGRQPDFHYVGLDSND
jgi:2-oxoglutarate/2-oxoacid ferredoxin oxidoreductase subunit beta